MTVVMPPGPTSVMDVTSVSIPTKKQWDHLLDRKTPGPWIESRWAVESGLPALGVDEKGRITTFVPGMNLILEKPGAD